MFYDPNMFQTQDCHFENFKEIDDSLIDLAPDMFEEIRNSLGSKGRGIRIAHLNVKGLLCKINEIILLIKESNMAGPLLRNHNLGGQVSERGLHF